MFVYNHGLEYLALEKFDPNNVTEDAYFPTKDSNKDISGDGGVERIRPLSEEKFAACVTAINNIIQQAEPEMFKYHRRHHNGH